MTTATQTPPEKCPICGMAEDWRDTDEGRVTRVTYMCGAKWAQYNAHRVPLSPPEWVSDCSHAMTAALRVGATLEPTPLELARDALLAAFFAERDAWESLVDVTQDETMSAADCLPMVLARDDAAIKVDDAARAYLALLEPAP